jgi:hypothetical protein
VRIDELPMSARIARLRGRILLVGLSMMVAGASAQMLDVTRHVIAGGGHSSGGSFTLDGTIGQADASAVVSGGAFEVQGGYWTGVAPIGPGVFRDGFENP